MAGVARQGDKCTGHGAFPPRTSTSGSGNVFINGKPAHRQGDSWEEHSDGESSHSGVSSSGSSTVFVNGKPLCRIGDSVNCGSKISDGSGNVFAN